MQGRGKLFLRHAVLEPERLGGRRKAFNGGLRVFAILDPLAADLFLRRGGNAPPVALGTRRLDVV